MPAPRSPELPPWHPEALARRRPYLAARGRVLNAVRRVFEELAFVEVDTPALQVSPGMEPHLQAFATELKGPHPDDRRPLYLHTSPEFAMKKLLVAGVPRLWQLAHVYRNGERSGTHAPEFSMLEWYRAGDGYRTLIEDCRELLRAGAEAGGRRSFAFRGMTCDPFGVWRVLTVPDAFREYAGIDLMATYDGSHDPDPAALAVTLTHADGSEENAFGYLDPLSSVAAFGLRPGENDVEYVPVGDRSRSVIRVRWYDTFEGV